MCEAPYAAPSGGRAADGVLCQGDDDKADEAVLPEERESKVYRKGYCRNEGDCGAESRRQKSVFVEHGLLRISGRQRL